MPSTGRPTATRRASRCCSREASFRFCTTSGFATGARPNVLTSGRIPYEACVVGSARPRGGRAAAGAIALVPPPEPRRHLGARRRRGAIQLRAPLLCQPRTVSLGGEFSELHNRGRLRTPDRLRIEVRHSLVARWIREWCAIEQ